MTPSTHPSWALFASEFHCRECGFGDAYRSRPRSFFERHVLGILYLQPVRCDRCYTRSYVSRGIPVRERIQFGRKEPESQPLDAGDTTGRVA